MSEPGPGYAIVSMPVHGDRPGVEIIDLVTGGWDQVAAQLRKRLQEGRTVYLFERLQLEVRPTRYQGYDFKAVIG